MSRSDASMVLLFLGLCLIGYLIARRGVTTTEAIGHRVTSATSGVFPEMRACPSCGARNINHRPPEKLPRD
jgi:hypothetical protein